MIIKPKAQQPGQIVQDGTYPATLTEVKRFTNAFGDRLGFMFRIDGGEFDGTVLMRTCTPQLTAKGKLADIVQGMTGTDITPQQLRTGIDLDHLTGKGCRILVIQSRGNNGNLYSNIERVFPAK